MSMPQIETLQRFVDLLEWYRTFVQTLNSDLRGASLAPYHSEYNETTTALLARHQEVMAELEGNTPPRRTRPGLTGVIPSAVVMERVAERIEEDGIEEDGIAEDGIEEDGEGPCNCLSCLADRGESAD
jgi:hypothetical protein